MHHEIKEGHVKAETHNGITTIEFFHPKSNSLPGHMLEALTHEIHSAGHDKDTKVIVLRSSGDKAFCAAIDEAAAAARRKQMRTNKSR